jgi:hypothetical protein
LAAALRASAAGLYTVEAAVELLMGHARWLVRDDFVDGFVETGEGWSDGTPLAWVNLQAAVAALHAGRLACAESEAGMLRVAASIAEGVRVDLRDAVSGLDVANVVLVARAVLHAAGHRGAVVELAGMVAR